MKNQTAIDTYNVLSQLNSERGMPLKFEYAVVKIIQRLEAVVKGIQAVSSKKIDGQEEYDQERIKLLISASSKDEKGNPIILNGSNYKIEDQADFNKKIEKLNKKHEALLDAVKARNEEIEELLDSDAEDFEPYMVNVKYLPVKDGSCRLSIAQLKHMMPFLEGDIEDIPETD